MVPLEQDEKTIVTNLEMLGISDIVTESNSQIINYNSKTPVQPEIGKWNEDRSLWFRNASHNCRYFYLAETPFLETKINKSFTDAHFSWYLEHSDGIKIFPVVLCFLLLFICLFLLKRRVLFFLYTIPVVFYTFFCNTVSGYLTSIFSIVVFYIFTSLLEPENGALSGFQRVTRIKHHPVSLCTAPIIIVIASTGGGHSLLMYGITLCLSFSILVLVLSLKTRINFIRERKRIHPVFRPIMMNPESIIGKWPKKTDIYIFLTAVLLSGTGFLLFNVQDSKTGISDKQELYIPSPSGYTKSTGFDDKNWTELSQIRTPNSLPDLGTYVSIRWNLETAPWRRIQETIRDPVAGESVGSNQFFSDKDGKISGKMNTMFTFDTNFIRKILSSGITPLETMLMRQGRFMAVEIARQER